MGIWRKLGVAAVGTTMLVVGASLPVGAEATGITATPANPSVLCSVFAGHYCAKIVYSSVTGGIRVKQTNSTGYTTGSGRGREWFRYSCTAGTCYTVPSRTFFYSRRLVQLNVNRFFTGSGFFLPCGNVFGVDYINPAINAPGPGPVLFRVKCAASGNTYQRL